jgi:DNA-binding CsgD family transcriptional regulator
MAKRTHPIPSQVTDRFGEAVARRRKELDCSAQKLSALCAQQQNVTVSRSIIAKIETGHRTYVTLDEFLAITAVLGIDRSQFVGNKPTVGPKLPPRRLVGRVYSEHTPLSADQLEQVVSKLSSKYRLTPRESEVLALLTEGLTYEEMAARLYVSYTTTSHYIKAVLGKLGLSSRRPLIRVILAEVYSLNPPRK